MRGLILVLMSNVCYLAVILIFLLVTWWLLLVTARYCSFLLLDFFFYFGFLSRTFTIHETAGEGGGYLFNSSLPLPPASQTLRHQPGDYCRELTSANSWQPDSNREPLVSERKLLTTKLRALCLLYPKESFMSSFNTARKKIFFNGATSNKQKYSILINQQILSF